jgi:thiol-disulfide isomerase/thioredoxin
MIWKLAILTLLLFNPYKKDFLPHSDNKGKVVDFTLTDTAGKNVSLSSFRGKFVIITMTAGWCGPCKEETSHIKELQNMYKDKDIAWIFVSFDRDVHDWKAAIQKEGLHGTHLWGKPASASLKKLFNFDSIPYFIWIDKEGYIVVGDAPRPSSHSAKKQLKYYVE